MSMTNNAESPAGDQIIEWLKEYQLHLMETLSEDVWCAGWMSGLEQSMWHGSAKDHPYSVKCREIAEVTGIWWKWNHGTPEDENQWRLQVPLDEWKQEMADEFG